MLEIEEYSVFSIIHFWITTQPHDKQPNILEFVYIHSGDGKRMALLLPFAHPQVNDDI
jgi:hypothetical protein